VVKGYKFPVLFGFPAGHINNNHAFYIGSNAKIEINGDIARMIFI
jgi:muramoyltetrapeptide carboxypeptidase